MTGTPAQQTAENTAKIADNTDPAVVIEAAVEVAKVAAEADFAPATTTAEENRESAALRERRVERRISDEGVAATRADRQTRLNMVWEYTQAGIAVMVVLTTAAGIFVNRVLDNNTGVTLPPEWWTIVGLVIGFYFSRSNHSRIGDEPRSARSTDIGSLDDR